MHVVAEAQRNGGICAYIDAEHAMDPVYAKAIGVDIDQLLISQPDTGEQALEIADMLIRSGALDVVVIDSVAALTPRAEIEGEMGDTHVGLQARLMSQALRKLTSNLNKSNTIAIFINQLREKIGVMFGSPETTPGGRALKFYSSVRLDIRRIESIKDGTEVVGNRTRVKVVKNKVAPPFRQAEFDIMYGKGISREGSLLDLSVDLGIVKKSGAWFTYDGEQLGQGRENAKVFLAENPEIMVEISERVLQQAGLGAADAEEPAAFTPADEEPIELDLNAGSPPRASGARRRRGLRPAERRYGARRRALSLGLPMTARTYVVRTFGCQMNEHDSERIAGLLEGDGLVPAASVDEADVVVLNTCCIRENADNKLYGNLGQLKRWKDAGSAAGRDRQIVVAGCLAQKDRDLVRTKAPYVDVVLGTHNVHRSALLLDQARRDGPVTEILDEAVADDHARFPSALPARRDAGYCAWVTIQIGCDNSCAFCIVPAVRGREISRPSAEIVSEVEALAAAGVSEVTLLGQNVNSYGRDLTLSARQAGEATRVRPLFAELLRAVGAVPGIRRVRYTSPHPKDLRPDTIAAMAETATVCNHLHLPLQAGSDRVLAAMHRGYTASRYLEKLAAARQAIADLAVSTDLIVGFPGETDEDFSRTLEVVAEAEYDSAYTFIYSPRPGTEAAAMAARFVPAETCAARFERLQGGGGAVGAGPAPRSHRPRRGGAGGGSEQEGSGRHQRAHGSEQAGALPARPAGAGGVLRAGGDHRRRPPSPVRAVPRAHGRRQPPHAHPGGRGRLVNEPSSR